MVQALENDHLNLSQNPSHPAWSLKSYWDSLSTVHLPEGTLIAMGDRIFVPQTERKRVLVELHKTHQGSVKTKLAAKESYFWSGMNNEISNILENCETCQTFRPSQKHDSQQNFVAELTRPMQLLSGDLFQYASKTYLLLVDGYSGYIFVDELKRTATRDIIRVLTKYFALFGYPDVFRSDNGPQFRTELKDFFDKRGVRHLTSSPYFPSSNGHAESGVKSAKHLLKKCLEDKSDYEGALAELRRQPRSDGTIPSDLFLNRHVKGDATQLPREFNPVDSEAETEIPTATATAEPNKEDLAILERGQIVRVQDASTKRWDRKAEIISICEFSRSYVLVDCENESTFRRNRIFLRPLRESDEADKELPYITEADETSSIIPVSPSTPRRSTRIAQQKQNVQGKPRRT
jgi:transposase InsO family protein